VLKSLVKVLGLVIGLVLSCYSYAISMGDINVTNTLGEPMNVLIELGTARKDEISSLTARLAPPEVFEDAGLDYPSGLPPLKFKIETNANGEPYIKITSMQPINEPFVNLLVELTWSSGKLLREYTFLLDPPGYVPAFPEPAEVEPVVSSIVDVSELEPKAAAAATTAAAAAATATATATATASEEINDLPFPSTPLSEDEEKAVDEIVEEIPQEIPVAVNTPNENSNFAAGTITVIRGDTLSDLALQTKSPDISLERALVALYRANADAFDGKNMNRLKVGAILRMPEQSKLDNQSQVEAVKVIRAQADDWHAYRQKLAAASGLARENESRQEASGKISTTVADDATVVKESAKEVVRLSKGESPDGNAKTLQNKIQALEEEAIAKSKALQESSERVEALEKTVQNLQRLIDLKSQPLAEQAQSVQNNVEGQAATQLDDAQTGAMLQVPADSEVETVSPVATDSSVKPLEKPKSVIKQPSILEVILGEPLYMVGGAAVLLGLIGLGYSLTRRGKDRKGKAKLGDKPIDHVIGSSNKPHMPIISPAQARDETNDIATISDTNQAQTDDFDPISGAELFLNFGRDEQAEKILKEGLAKNPANHQIHLKLLSIYSDRKDARSFATIARQLRDSGDANAWEQAAIMGLKLEPNNPMYGGNVSAKVEKSFVATPSPDVVPNEDKTNKTPSALDFDLDLDFNEPTASLDSAETNLSKSESKNATMDFDVTASHAKLPASSIGKGETSSMNLDNSILDVTADDAFAPEKTPEKAETVAPDNANEPMDFTLNFPDANNKSDDKFEVSPVKATPKETMDIGLSDISLNMDKPTVSAPTLSAEERDASWHDVATKLDLAKAYQEMGDAAGAREILEEVVREGDEQQRIAAEALLQQLSA